MDAEDVAAALRSFVRGDFRRSSLQLVSDSGEDVEPHFRRVALEEGYAPKRVADVSPASGRRVPAFLVRNGRAWFGWIFDERFTDERRRRLFASVERDHESPQHDWRVILGVGSKEELLVNEGRSEAFDPNRPDLY